jgi:hypothetical protein
VPRAGRLLGTLLACHPFAGLPEFPPGFDFNPEVDVAAGVVQHHRLLARQGEQFFTGFPSFDAMLSRPGGSGWLAPGANPPFPGKPVRDANVGRDQGEDREGNQPGLSAHGSASGRAAHGQHKKNGTRLVERR